MARPVCGALVFFTLLGPVGAQNSNPPEFLCCKRSCDAFPLSPNALAEDVNAPAPEPEPAPAPPPGPPPDLGCHCQSEKDVIYGTSNTQAGGIIYRFAGSAEDCCDMCRHDPKKYCTHFSWQVPGTRKQNEETGKTVHNCLLMAHGEGDHLIRHRVPPAQNRTSGYLAKLAPVTPTPPPPPPVPAGKLKPLNIIKNDLQQPWVPYGGIGIVLVSMMSCLAVYDRRTGRVGMGSAFRAMRRGGANKRRDYDRIDDVAPSDDFGSGGGMAADVESEVESMRSDCVSSVSSAPVALLADGDTPHFDVFAKEFTVAVSKLVRDRNRMVWTYKQCFVGSEALEWIKHWSRAGGLDAGADERAAALATKLLRRNVIEKVNAAEVDVFKADEFYRLSALKNMNESIEVERGEGCEADDEMAVGDEGAAPGWAKTDAERCSSDEIHQYDLAVKVLSAALNTGIQPSEACLERLASTIPPLLACSLRLQALVKSSSYPNLAALVDKSTGAENAGVAEHAHALQEALRDRHNVATHTLFTQADRLRVAVFSLKQSAAGGTQRYNLRNSPLLMLLSVDGVRTKVLRQLGLSDLCRMRAVCQSSMGFVHETLREMPAPTIFGGLTDGRALSAVSQLRVPWMGWAPLPPMIVPRCNPGICRTEDGVILVGGRDEGNVLSSVEEFDPVAQRWRHLPPMQTPRLGCRATVLQDGRVLVMGGFDGQGVVPTVEAYCPTSRRWSTLRSMSTPRTGFAACTLADGTVVAAGGFGNSGALSAVEQYDPALDEWRLLPSMSTERSGCAGCFGPCGRFWVGGGLSKGERLSSCEVLSFDAAADRFRWRPAPPMNQPRHQLALCTVAGQLVAMGGECAPGSPRVGAKQKDVRSVEVFDDGTQRWVCMASLPMPQTPCSACSL